MAFEISQEEYRQEQLEKQQQELLKKIDTLLTRLSPAKPTDLTPLVQQQQQMLIALQNIKAPEKTDMSGVVAAVKELAEIQKAVINTLNKPTIKKQWTFDVEYGINNRIKQITAKEI